ncbi:MAG: hypothetical protein M1833_005700 [Piccolia ochrophora]|nr:MAG: hypothetical protein M1833_005700 [Piccolia ochrophora]
MAPSEIRDEYTYEAQALPTPADTPYRTPSHSLSRRSSQYDASSQLASSSPPPMPSDQTWLDLKDAANDETISPLDPRRFTPTLHANLVSEILSLRRDLDSKSSFIENLETSLEKSRLDHENLNDTLSSTAKETRSLRRQLQLLEGGTSSALGELARERDEAVDNAADTKRRLELSQKKVRSHEEDSTRVQNLWESDKQSWENEKRNMERKVHVVEGRLRAILEEVAAQQAAAQANGHLQDNATESETEEAGRDGGRPPSVQSTRPMSAMSNDSVRFSMLNGTNGQLGTKLGGLSLAEELENDEEDEVLEEQDNEDSQSMAGIDKLTNGSKQAMPRTRGHVKTPSLRTIDEIYQSSQHDFLDKVQALAAPSDGQAMRGPEIEYVDTGVQFTPPSSPKTDALSLKLTEADLDRMDDRAASPTDNEANSRRKRVAASYPAAVALPELPQIIVPRPSMISASSQTQDEPLSPPKTPKTPDRTPPSPPSLLDFNFEMVSAATQTETEEELAPRRAPPPPPIPVPSISIHPPTSAPPTPGVSLLPQHTKNVACQTVTEKTVKQRSVSVQTEEIRVDKRLVKLPPNLLPSALSSHPPSSGHGAKPESETSNRPAAKRTSKKALKSQPRTEIPSSPPPNDDGPLRADKLNGIRRPFRSSSLFAGFDIPSSDDGDDFEPELSDGDYRTALSAPKPSQAQKAASFARKNALTTGEYAESKPEAGLNLLQKLRKVNGIAPSGDPNVGGGQTALGARRSSERTNRNERGLTLNQTKLTNARRTSLAFGGPAHAQRARSPSLGEIRDSSPPRKDPTPPFPVPTRSSSRKIPISSSEGARSPTLPGNSFNFGHRRKDSIRKVRSAAAIARNSRRPRQGSPPPMSTSSAAPESPQLPPLPRDDITTPRNPGRFGHRRQRSNNTTNTGGASVASSGQHTTVVDAIAQTMVGEWMWKYVRRRKSFGKADTTPAGLETSKPGEDGIVSITSIGTRHKRWVWLAPYERAVMWSSKQPTSGTALLGKSGRKLVIQSVLDVKDEITSPKSATGPQAMFDRSILILTPARALKFTATSLERHHVWLIALSFLSRSTQGAPELASLPPVPQQEYEPPAAPEGPGLRRNPIRDSIRVAKGKTRPSPNGSFVRPSASAGATQETIQEISDKTAGEEPLGVPADPPNVPRFSVHGRKRSNTGGRAPNSSFRTFSHQPMPSSNYSFATNGSSEVNGPGSSLGGLGVHSGQSSVSHRTSEASGPPGLSGANFFDAVGTVRMEAFVNRSPLLGFHEPEIGRGLGAPARQSKSGGRENHWRGHTDFYGNRLEDPEDILRADDPFRGF